MLRVAGAHGCGGDTGAASGDGSHAADDDSVVPSAQCERVGGSGAVVAPALLFNLAGNTGWYSSPAIVDLDGDGDMEIVAPFYDVFVYDHTGAVIHQEPTDNHHFGRVYMPAVVAKTYASEVTIADLNGDAKPEILFSTYALGPGYGRLVVLGNDGALVHDIPLQN